LGRKKVLVAGWLFALPVPILILAAPGWEWVIAANALLGINQGLCWSLTVNMKIDLVGPRRRGLALGLNETAGYLAVGVAALLSAPLAGAFGLRRGPFGLAIGVALAGLVLSTVAINETRSHVALEAEAPMPGQRLAGGIRSGATWLDRDLLACSQAGLVNNLNDALVWGLLPLLLLARGAGLGEIALVSGAYAISWGALQLPAGALSDHLGRRGLIVAGMLSQGAGLLAIGEGRGLGVWVGAALVTGAGTAMVYPTLLAAVSDIAIPAWRASAVGVYRLWRDLGYPLGAVVAGVIADLAGIPASVATVAGLTVLSGMVVALRLRETAPGVRAASPAVGIRPAGARR
jgi:MFS family permease